jgi:hypothetical protein
MQNDRKTYAKEPQEDDPLTDLLASLDDIDLDGLFDDLDVDAILADLAAVDLDDILSDWTGDDLAALLDW